MREAARHFVGTHDFRNICQIDIANVQHFVREIISVRIVPPPPPSLAAASTGPPFDALQRVSLSAPALPSSASASPGVPLPGLQRGADEQWHALDAAADTPDPAAVYYIQVIGNAFLWHQIRCVAAVLFHVGRRYEPPSVVRWLLDPQACPSRPNYALAPEAPLVLYHAGFERDAGSWDAPAAAATEGAVVRDGAAASALPAGPPAAPQPESPPAAPQPEEPPAAPQPESVAAEGDCGAAATPTDGRPRRFGRSDEGLYERMYASPAALRKATADLEAAWAEAATRAAVLRGLLDRVYALPVREEDVVAALQQRTGGGGGGGGATAGRAAAGAAAFQEDAGALATHSSRGASMTWGEAVAKYGGAAAAWRTPASMGAAGSAAVQQRAHASDAATAAAAAPAMQPPAPARAPPPPSELLLWAANAEYPIHGAPPVAVATRLVGPSQAAEEEGAGVALAAATQSALPGVATRAGDRKSGGGSGSSSGGYIPFALRQKGKSVAEKWAALSPQTRAQAERLHPVNTARLVSQQQAQPAEVTPRDEPGHDAVPAHETSA